MSPPLISVTIPSYNYVQYLREAVESAATQTGADVEVVIIENASTDGSVDLARELAAEYANVRLVEHRENFGIMSSLNRCRDEVRGEYAVLLCADDRLVPGVLARSLAVMEEHPEVGIAYGPVVPFHDEEEVDPAVMAAPVRPAIVYPGERWIAHCARIGTIKIYTPEVLARTSVLNEAGRLDPACPKTSDFNMWLRVAIRSDVAYVPGPPLAMFRFHAGNDSSGYTLHDDIEQRWVAFSLFFDTIPDHPERLAWESAVRRALAREARFEATRSFLRTRNGGDPGEADQLLALAGELHPSRSLTRTYSWKMRHALGPQRSSSFPLFLPRRALGRLQDVAAQKRRLRTGL